MIVVLLTSVTKGDNTWPKPTARPLGSEQLDAGRARRRAARVGCGRRRRWDTRVGEISCRPRACGRVSALWKAPTRTCGWMPRSSAPGSGEACARRALVIAYAVHEWGV